MINKTDHTGRSLMRSILLGLCLFCSDIGHIFALSNADLPSYFSIEEQQCDSHNCFDLTTRGKTLIGALRPRPYTSGTFEFFDQENQRQVMVKFTESVGGVSYFHIYDNNQALVATLDIWRGLEDSFYLFSAETKIILATGVSTAFKTSYVIYDKASWTRIAELSRPMFTSSLDTEVEIVNKPLFLARVDPNVMAAVIALFCSYGTPVKADNIALHQSVHPKFIKGLQSKLKKIAAEYRINNEQLVATEAQNKAAVALLKQRYQEVYDDTYLSEEEKIQQFIAFGCDLVQTHTLSPTEEQAILQFLIRYNEIEERKIL